MNNKSVGKYANSVANDVLLDGGLLFGKGLVIFGMGLFLLTKLGGKFTIPGFVLLAVSGWYFVRAKLTLDTHARVKSGSDAEKKVAKILQGSGVKKVLMNVIIPPSKGDIDFILHSKGVIVGEIKAGGGGTGLSYTNDGRIITGKGKYIANGKSVRDQADRNAHKLSRYLGIQNEAIVRIICVTNARSDTLDMPWENIIVCSLDNLKRAVNLADSIANDLANYMVNKLQNLEKNGVVVK